MESKEKRIKIIGKLSNRLYFQVENSKKNILFSKNGGSVSAINNSYGRERDIIWSENVNIRIRTDEHFCRNNFKYNGISECNEQELIR